MRRTGIRAVRQRLLLKRALTAVEIAALSALPLAPVQAHLPPAREQAAAGPDAADGASRPNESDAEAGVPSDALETGPIEQLAQGGLRSGLTRSPGGNREPALFKADEVDYDQDLSLVVARGHVEIDQAGRILLADTVTYNQKTDTVTASGNTSVLEANGDILFADYVELTDKMRDAFASNARIMMTDKSRVAGNTGRRTDGSRTELRKAVYSPCQLCADNPAQPPTWQIKADSIIHDANRKEIEYRDAFMEFSGVPLLYTPYLSTPDPTVRRASGFLVPAFGDSTTLGVWFSVPYYWVLDTDKDLTLAPIFATNEGVVAAGEYRQRFDSGRFDGRFSVTDSDRIGEDPITGAQINTKKGKLRGDVFASGIWNLDEEDRTGFDIRRATDQTYLRRYHLGGSDDFLTSHAYVENFDRRDYGSIDAYAFQSQRLGVVDNQLPFVLPQARYSFVGQPSSSTGARLTLDEDFLNIVRQKGNNTIRATTMAAWSLPLTTPGGDQLSLTPRLLGQAYAVSRYPRLTQTPTTSSSLNPALDQTLTTATAAAALAAAGSTTNTQDATVGRGFPQLEASWRHPFVNRGEDRSAILEPIAALFMAPRGGNDRRIPNEDSLGFEFNDSSLFEPNRFPGLDRIDGGSRVDYGIHGALFSDTKGYRTDFLIGQSYRFSGNENFAVGSGLQRSLSDPVGRITFSPLDELSISYRFRFAETDLASRRQEVTSTFGPSRIRTTLTYINLKSDVGSALPNRSELVVGLRLALTPYWTVYASNTQNLSQAGSTLASSGGITYTDDCLTLNIAAIYTGTTDTDVVKGTSFAASLTLKNLGQIALPSLKA